MIAKAGERYPDITITYEHVTAQIFYYDYAQFRFIGSYADAYLSYTLEQITYDLAITLAERVFELQTNLSEVHMAELTALPTAAFMNCSRLETVDLPKVATIGSQAFTNCNNVKTLYLPGATTMSASNAFTGCSYLRALRLPKLTGTFAASCIMNDNALEVMDLGKIGTIQGSLLAAQAISKLVLRNTGAVVTASSGANLFYADSPMARGNGQILVPRELVSEYKAHANWSSFAAMISAIEDSEEESNG